jgi:hypothetical protein
MPNKKVIVAKYIDFIADAVVGQYGGSYQTVASLGKQWRQKMDYKPGVETFIIEKTKLFLNVLPDNVQSNFNVLYLSCQDMADWVSKYIAKKSPDVKRADVKNQVMDEIFYNSVLRRQKFKKVYRKPIDLNDEQWVAANPGVVAMYQRLQHTN